MSRGNDPAYPLEIRKLDETIFHHGLTIRERFIMAAMQGLVANSAHADQVHNYVGTAEVAIKIADATLAAMEKHDGRG